MEGQKFDEGKSPLFMLKKQFPDAIREVANCSQAGHLKYPNDHDWMNFKRVSLELDPFRYLNAAERHLLESQGELKIDEDLKAYKEVFHLAQTAWNILAHLQLRLESEKYK